MENKKCTKCDDCAKCLYRCIHNTNPDVCKPPKVTRTVGSLYERTRAAVYATGNKWAIENFHATHD